MSEYKIVNRVHPTPAFAQTVAEVEAQAKLDKSLPLVQEVAKNPEVAKVLRKKGFNVPLVGSDYEEPDEAFKFLEMPKPSAENVGKVLTSQVCNCGEEIAQEIKTAEASRVQNPGVLKGLKTEFHVPVPKAGDTMKIPFHVGETIRFVETAETSRAPLIGKTEEWQPEEGPLVIAFETPESGEVITREEFEQLKADLVLAFKKMGFDVSL